MKILQMRTERPLLVFWLPDGLCMFLITLIRGHFFIWQITSLFAHDFA